MEMNCPCMDCRSETMEYRNAYDDYYMVLDHVWKEAVPEFEPTPEYASLNKREFLCLDCLEKRLKRKLTKNDFREGTDKGANLKVREKYFGHTFKDWEKHLYKDVIMGKLIATHGELTLVPSTDYDQCDEGVQFDCDPNVQGSRRWRGSYFADLVNQITGQQLSVKAAASIWKRLVDLFAGRVEPKILLEADDETLRAVGLSRPKIRYIKGLGQEVLDGSLDLDELPTLDNETVLTRLSSIKGIGRWTAEMFLIFTLAREDVFSIGDLGLKNAVKKLYGVITDAEILQIAQRWSPYRSYACFYLWRSLDNTPKK